MKRILIISLVVISIIVMFLFFYYNRKKQEHSISGYYLSSDEYQLLKDGDIILRHGYGMVSDFIVETLDEKYDISHCAVIVKDKKKFNVIHTVSQTLSDFDGVQSQTLSRFISDCKPNSIIVVRFKSDKDSLIADRAKYYLSQKIPFDNNFDTKDTSCFYCTELIWKIIKDVHHVDILKNNLKISDKKSEYRFNAFWDTSLFQIIINHQNKI